MDAILDFFCALNVFVHAELQIFTFSGVSTGMSNQKLEKMNRNLVIIG